MAEPIMDQYAKVSSYDVHAYQVRCTFDTGTTLQYRSRDATPARATTTTVKVTLPKVYTEVVGFKTARFAAVGVAALEWILSTNNVNVDGTLTFTSVNSAGAATAPAVGDVVFFDIMVSCDVLNDRFLGAG